LRTGRVRDRADEWAPSALDSASILRQSSIANSCEELIDVARCEVCGNDYDKAMEITVAGSRHVFDSFECAIHAIAPRCEHCDCTVIGHGVEADGHFFCCAHCARENGFDTLTDRVGPAVA
jgi:hypothetical protein